MGLFSSVAGLFGGNESKPFKDNRGDMFAALYGPGTRMSDIPQPKFYTGTATNPFGTSSYGPGGATFTLSNPMQNLFNQGIQNQGVTNDLLADYAGSSNFLSEGPLFDMLNQSRLGANKNADRAAANAIGNLWNARGSGSDSGYLAAGLQDELDRFKALQDFNVVSNLLGLRKDILGQRDTGQNYLGNFGAYSNLADAQNVSSDITNLELQKFAQAMNANTAYNQARVNDTNLLQRFGNLADEGMRAYMSGGGDFGGGAFGNIMKGAYGQSDPLADAIAQFMGGGNTFNTPYSVPSSSPSFGNFGSNSGDRNILGLDISDMFPG